MNRRTFLTASATALTAAPLFAQPKEKVKIVSSLPRTGSAKGQTDTIVNAIQMALADFAKAVPFEIVYLDWDDSGPRTGTWEAEFEKENAEKAAKDKDVMAFIGPYNSGAARVSMPVLNRAGLVQVSPAATWPGLTKKTPNADLDEPEIYRPAKKLTFCRVCPHDGSQAPLSAEFAANDLKAKTVYVLDDKELYGAGVATAFKKRCEELKVKVLGHESLTPRGDYKELLKKIKEKAPDLLYFGGTTQSGGPQIALDMKGVGLKCPLMVPDGCYEQAFIVGAEADTFDEVKCYVTVGGISPAHLKGAGADFVKRYKDKHGLAPGVYSVYGYEAAAVVLHSLATAGKKDREAVRAAVLGTKNFDKGLIGKWSFDADGDTTHQPVTVATIEKGQFKSVKVLGWG